MDDGSPTAPRDHASEARDLTDTDWTAGVQVERAGSLRAAISNAMVGLKKQYYGKGPTRAKTYLNDNYVFCVLEDVATRSERTLIERGYEKAVRAYRLEFQEAVAGATTTAIERLTGRQVLGYHSQILFDPDISIEMFVLDAPPEPDAAGGGTAPGALR